jgi:hypothetical protein
VVHSRSVVPSSVMGDGDSHDTDNECCYCRWRRENFDVMVLLLLPHSRTVDPENIVDYDPETLDG